MAELQSSTGTREVTPAEPSVVNNPRQTTPKRRHLLAVIAVAALLIAMLAGPRLFRSQPRAPKPQITSEQNSNAANTGSSAIPVQSEPERVSDSGIISGSVLHQVLPNVSQTARNTIQGKVSVRVKLTVDESGNVMEASFLSPGPCKYFARLAMQASRDWKFTPPQMSGQPIPSEWVLKFAFGRTTTEVYPAQK